MDASTSTSAHANNNHYYDVFVNHRGPDVKKTFASHLYRRLIPHRLRVFLDYEEMRQGENLTPQIKEAIESASVHVAIFSPGYAQSKWCLNELLDILESKAPIIPVFYNVEPADLRCTHAQSQGVYAQALSDLENKRTDDGQLRYSSTTIGMWKGALSRVAETSGLDLKAFNGDEGVLLDNVIECVLKNVKKTPLNVAKHPTGLDEKAKAFEETVLSKQHSGRVQVVGIAGMGGLGKTTLAKELFNRKSSNYSKSYFLSDVRENAIKSSLHSLQSQLLNGLVQLNPPIDNIHQGIEMLKKHLENMRVLIVLDDVDNVDQVDSLLPMQDVLQPESLILITSRDKNVLSRSGVQESSIYQLTGLNERHSTELFCSYAFCQPHPLPEFESFVDQFLEACNGLPLALKVFGGLVYGKDTPYWEMQLKKFEQSTLDKDIQKSLQISYDALDGDEKQVFLDIACFFIGEKKDMAIRIWDGSGWSGLLRFQTLQEKCLVEVDIENKIRMHDQLRDLGRDLARHPALPRRLWRGKEDIHDLRQHSSVHGIANVRGIRWTNQFNEDDGDEDDDTEEEDGDEDDDAESSYLTRKWSQLTEEVKVTKLQLLDVNILSENFMRGVDSPNITWLRWESCHFSSLPPWIPTKNLRVLEVHGSDLETLWKGKSKVPSQLRELRIFAPLSKIPESIGRLKHLERIEIRHSNFEDLPTNFDRLLSLKDLLLSRCLKMTSLPDSLGNLTNLEHIDLDRCTLLERLANSFKDLSRLRTIKVSDCPQLEELPGLENLRSLEELDVYRCVKMKSIRGSAELTKLRIVKVIYCPGLEELQGFENLRSLEELHISSASLLKSIRGSAELTKLRIVKVIYCPGLEELPGFENLRSLEELHISSCVMLKSIRGSAELTKLRIVKVIYCPGLEELPGFENLRSLEELRISECAMLKSIRGSAELTKLRIVEVSDCPELEELPGLENLRSLEELHVYRCVKMKSIRGSAELTKLRIVNVHHCPELEELPGFENLRSLEKLHISSCVMLKSIQGSAELTKLRIVNVTRCLELEELPGFENLRSLEELHISSCVMLKSIRGSAELTKLRIVNVTRCLELEELPGFENLRSLEELHLSSCVMLKSLRGSAELTKLRIVNVTRCLELEELPGFENLRSLEELHISSCVMLKSIRGSAELTKLRIVKVIYCPGLEELSGFENLRSLEELHISSCVMLKSIRGSAELTKLRIVNVTRCLELEELPGFENLRSLEELHISSCVMLKSIRGSAELTKLRIVNVTQCLELEELPGFENLRSLEELHICECVMLKSIRGSAELSKLRKVNVSDCRELEELPGFENLRSLEEVYVNKCLKVKSIRGSAELTKLRIVKVILLPLVRRASGFRKFEVVGGASYIFMCDAEEHTWVGGAYKASNSKSCLLPWVRRAAGFRKFEVVGGAAYI